MDGLVLGVGGGGSFNALLQANFSGHIVLRQLENKDKRQKENILK